MAGDSSSLLAVAGIAATLATGGLAAPAVGAAAAGAGAAGATTGASLFTLANAATALSVGTSLFGAYSGYQSSRAESAQIEQQSQYESLRAQQEEADRKERLNIILGEQAAATAGRGISLGSGSSLAIADFSTEEAAREGRIASMDSKFKKSQFKMEATQTKKRGTASLISGVGDAAGKGYGAYTKYQDRKLTTA